MPEGPPPVKRTEGQPDFDLEKWLATELPRQYQEQLEMLVKFGVVDTLPIKDETGIVGIDGQEYPIPTLAEIEAKIRENPEKYETKIRQGFTQMLLVPFAKPLAQLLEIVKNEVENTMAKGEIFYFRKEGQEPDAMSDPWLARKFIADGEVGDYEREVLYYPSLYLSAGLGNSKLTGGKSKEELLAEREQGWEIKLVEDLGKLVEAGDPREQHGRHTIAVGFSSGQDLLFQIEQGIDGYDQFEQGITLEDQIMRSLIHLKRTGELLGTHHDPSKSIGAAGRHREKNIICAGSMVKGNRFLNQRWALSVTYQPEEDYKEKVRISFAVTTSYLTNRSHDTQSLTAVPIE